MKLEPDKKLHLLGGAALALFFVVVTAGPFVLAREFSLTRTTAVGIAVMFSSVAAGWGLEKYQEIRREGIKSVWDWVATSAPGVALGFGIALWGML